MVDGNVTVLRMVHKIIRAGLALQQVGLKGSEKVMEEIELEVEGSKRARPFLARWRRAVLRGGLRQAGLREAAMAMLDVASITMGLPESKGAASDWGQLLQSAAARELALMAAANEVVTAHSKGRRGAITDASAGVLAQGAAGVAVARLPSQVAAVRT